MNLALLSLVTIGLSPTFALPVTGDLPDYLAFPHFERKDAYLHNFGDLPAFASDGHGNMPAHISLHASGEDDQKKKIWKETPVAVADQTSAQKLKSQVLQHLECPDRSVEGSKAYSKRQSPKLELAALEDMLEQILHTILKPPSAGPNSPNDAPTKTKPKDSTESLDVHKDDVGKKESLLPSAR
ncbi:hypothetical protein BST61_g3625 [Cercospora zeina]